MIYAIRAGSFGSIKIGRATNPIARLAELQTAHHEVLNLLAAVKWPDDTETRLHRHLAEYKLIGEWFKPSELVLWVVEMMRDYDAYHVLFSTLAPDDYLFQPGQDGYVNQLALYEQERASALG